MAGQQQGGQDSAGSMDFLWLTALSIFGILILWYFAKVYILTVVFQIKYAEMYLIQFFTDNILPAKQFADYFYPHLNDITVHQLGAWLTDIGSYLKYPVAVTLVGLAGYLYFMHPNTRFHTVFDMKKLLDKEVVNWPQIVPVSHLDLLNTPINEGPWAMALSPMEFAKKHQLLREERNAPEQGVVRAQQRDVTVTLLEDKANQVFATQMGGLWQGPEELPLHIQALFAIFASKGMQQRKTATDLLHQIARSAAKGTTQLNLAGVKEVLAKYKGNPTIDLVTSRHAYVLTVMASMLLYARSDGVLATADFLWLKPLDRPLWYMLCSIGRQTPFSEVAGPFAHWLGERALKRRISQPMIQEATKALNLAIKSVIYVPDGILADPLEKM